MNISIINHLFLPPCLPASANDDYLLANDHGNEHGLFEYINKFFDALQTQTTLPVFRTLVDCTKRWSYLQNPDYFTLSNLQSVFAQLHSGESLPLYFHKQNAAILIEMNENQPWISSWQVLLPSEQITSSILPHFSCFPTKTYKLNNRSQLTCQLQCELLIDLMMNTIEGSKIRKFSSEVAETREVPESHYVCQWWIQQFQGIQIEKKDNQSLKFHKKHRDQIRWYDAALPFRRSGLWMTIKVVFQTILLKHLKDMGTVLYKTLITYFLTDVLHSQHTEISMELRVHCARKIMRRMNKIENRFSSTQSNEVNKCLEYINGDMKKKIKEIVQRFDEQISMQESISSRGDDADRHHHSCKEFQAYLKTCQVKPIFRVYSNTFNTGIPIDQSDYLPSITDFKTLMNYSTSIALTRIEIWIHSSLKQWIHSSKEHFKRLFDFFQEYQSTALDAYCSKDPLGYSRFLLASLTLLQCMHEELCQDQRFRRLQQHAIHIPYLMELFEYLILPNREEMIRARDLYEYLKEFSEKPYPDLLENIQSPQAFGVHYVGRTIALKESLRRLRGQAERDKQMKIDEITRGKEQYQTLMDSIYLQPCLCVRNLFNTVKCHRCQIEKQANSLTADIYECPIPTDRTDAYAVIFELEMPVEIRYYRDILWQFINRPNPDPKNGGMYNWLDYPPHSQKLHISPLDLTDYRVKLVSSTKSISHSHYSKPLPVGTTDLKKFFHENSFEVAISPTKSISLEEECELVTFQLTDPDYRDLQFTLNSTEFVQNDVIAMLSECSVRLKPIQFIEFGSFRSGHRLQWWNLLTILEIDSLNISEESVMMLILQSILQYGPITPKLNPISWCPESHQQLLEDHFLDELIVRLHRYLDDCQLNWQNELALTVIVMITMRILTLCNSTREDQVIELVKKCREVGAKWIDLICENIQSIPSPPLDEIENLRLKLTNTGAACLLTYSADDHHIHHLLSTNQDILFLLKSATTVHDNITLSENRSNISLFQKIIMEFRLHALIILQPLLFEILRKTNFTSLNEFVRIYWSVLHIENQTHGEWKKRYTDPYDGWYDCQYGPRFLSIDCIQGKFLVDGMPIGFLPENITSHDLFIRIFDHHIFEVQTATSPQTYITKHGYHDENVFYEFYLDEQTNLLIIKEQHRQSTKVLQLIPESCFQNEFPDAFVTNYSHWWNPHTRCVQFRSIHFTDPAFFHSSSSILSMDKGYVTTKDKQILISRSSKLFRNLFQRYFIRLDDEPYVYMMSEKMIGIHLSRLKIAFYYNECDDVIISREYSNMRVCKDQRLDTFIGLKSGLLLGALPGNNEPLDAYQNRKLIVPFGDIHARKTSENDHQIVTIKRQSVPIDFLHQYFVFILNDRLKIVQSMDSPTGCLYLSLLHAMTSSPLSDRYTGMTGMERSFQLLNSAACYSDQPYDQLSLNILEQIASISPKVDYYPPSLTRMQKIEWNTHSIPYSMQHFGYYLIVKHLIHTSQQFSYMYPSDISEELPGIFEKGKHNERLLKKLYWDYRDSYNPLARLPAEIEADILKTSSTGAYRLDSTVISLPTNYTRVHLIDDLYNNGNLHLRGSANLRWLPLSQWFADKDEWRNLWIDLLRMAINLNISNANRCSIDLDRYEKLLDFLHYISKTIHIHPFYFQMLKTALKASNISSSILQFPPLMFYNNIDQVSFLRQHIRFFDHRQPSERNEMFNEAEESFNGNRNFENRKGLATAKEVMRINQCFTPWRNNKNLRNLLNLMQNQICSNPIEYFDVKVPYIPQKFARECREDHYEIQIRSLGRIFDEKLLHMAEQKYKQSSTDHRPTSSVALEGIGRLPSQIFPSGDHRENSLSEISDFFENQLKQSWDKLQSDQREPIDLPARDTIIKILHSLEDESREIQHLLIKSIELSNEILFDVGLMMRLTPTVLISHLLQQTIHLEKVSSLSLTENQCALLGGLMVNWTLEQRWERALIFASNNQTEEFEKEISNIPHVNWIPSEHLSWLILELEMNITIRKIQVDVARHMMQSTDGHQMKSIVMQMNMGEGKTSVILPMLALSLSSSSSTLVRMIVLKSLFPMNYQSLKHKLGGMLNRRVFPFASRRDMNFDQIQINQIFNRFQRALANYEVILTSPEDLLSFELLIIDKCRRQEYEIARSMLITQRWLKHFIRDILDESDEILHVKYQLIYTVGGQQQVDGGAERWKTIQVILHLVKQHAEDIAKDYGDDVCYQPSDRSSAFPQFRLQSSQPYSRLCEKIADQWINRRPYRKTQRSDILSFILHTDLSIDSLVHQFSPHEIDLFLIIRGLLSSEVLLVALKKRYRVNYGINPNPTFHRLMAVPFRAKDVPAERTEFGHPDVALVLTQLSYYYSGLDDQQMMKCFTRLSEEESQPASIYDQWISFEDQSSIPSTIRQWTSVNLKDYQQRTHSLFPTFRFNILVIDYFLNHFVYPREAKQYPQKLISSAWDLSSPIRTQIITGFSGTNDTQLLLPIHIQQNDLPHLQKTDALVINHILQRENEDYHCWTMNTTFDEIVKYRKTINVILDVGALFIDGTNRDMAVRWLELSDRKKIDYAVYFHRNEIFVCDRDFHPQRFEMSPARERLDRCIFYIDEIHTRGTDFKFPNDFRAMVTLGNGLTKDRLVQAAMRMRKLGKHHFLTFWSSYEVDQQIKSLQNHHDPISIIDILRWVYQNTHHAIWDGLHHWSVQSLNYQQKVHAFRMIDWKDSQQGFDQSMMERLSRDSLEDEVIQLKSLYGASKKLQRIESIYLQRYKHRHDRSSEDIHRAVLQRLKDYGGSKQRLAQLLDEEQQRELELELEEERQLTRPPRLEPCEPILHKELERLCDPEGVPLSLEHYSDVFRPLVYAFTRTTYYDECQAVHWAKNLWISTEFQRVIQTRGESLNSFLRPPRWILVYRNHDIIFLSPLEANWFMIRLNRDDYKMHSSNPLNTTLRLFLPRTKKSQSIFVNTSTLMIPPSISIRPFVIPVDWLAQLFVFNGTLFFDNVQEQVAYCQCLSLCPRPRTPAESDAFEKGWISTDGFVKRAEHRLYLQIHQSAFSFNPIMLVKQLAENRNNSHVSITSHVGSILLDAKKLLLTLLDIMHSTEGS